MTEETYRLKIYSIWGSNELQCFAFAETPEQALLLAIERWNPHGERLMIHTSLKDVTQRFLTMDNPARYLTQAELRRDEEGVKMFTQFVGWQPACGEYS